jgi:hypothetical protein
MVRPSFGLIEIPRGWIAAGSLAGGTADMTRVRKGGSAAEAALDDRGGNGSAASKSARPVVIYRGGARVRMKRTGTLNASRVRTAIDSPHTESWLAPIGKLVVNFGALELESYLWIGLLSDGTQIDWALCKRFKSRVDRIILQLLPEKVTEAEVASDSTRQWDEAIKIAKFRNLVLHSPLVFAHSMPDESGPPDVIGMPDLRKLGQANPIQPLAKLSDINSAVNRIVACATRLDQLRGRVRTLLSREAI